MVFDFGLNGETNKKEVRKRGITTFRLSFRRTFWPRHRREYMSISTTTHCQRMVEELDLALAMNDVVTSKLCHAETYAPYHPRRLSMKGAFL